MKNINLTILTLILSMGVASGCAQKEKTAEKAKEAASAVVESAGPKGAEVKKAAPVAGESGEKSIEKKAVTSGGASAEAKKAPAEPVKALSAGAAIFKANCSPCHGVEGKGTPMAPAFKGNAWIKSAAKGEIADTIKNGRQGSSKKYKEFVLSMPSHKDMLESDVNALIDYLKSIN